MEIYNEWMFQRAFSAYHLVSMWPQYLTYPYSRVYWYCLKTSDGWIRKI